MKTGFLTKTRRAFIGLAAALLVTSLLPLPAIAQTDPLPSWNDSASRTAIIDFVKRVTTEGSPDFVPQAERIATFDNDGTLWSEQPMYFQLAFVLDRIKARAKDHPEWKEKQPYKAILDGNIKAFTDSGEKGVLEVMAATHSGMSVSEFQTIVQDWLKTAHHPRFNRPYIELVYQPMLELLDFLRANGFRTYIVSGGGVEFMRPWAEAVYGIPPEQVIGSSSKTEFHLNNGKPTIEKLPQVEFIDDGPGKPVGINRFIGRRPVMAVGNSDDDLQMLQWTTLNTGPRLGLIIHHTDAEREWNYDRDSHVGKLNKALDEAPDQGWIVVDMRHDWKVIYPFQR